MPGRLAIEPPWDQRLARLAVAPLRATPVTPNQITTLGLAIGLLGGVLYAYGGAAAHLGAVCVVVALWLDHADGELARLTGRTSVLGHYYDLAVSVVILAATFVGIGIGVPPGPLDAWGPMLGVIAGLAVAVIFTLRQDLERRLGKTATRQPNLLGFEPEDVLYLLGPITWLGLLEPFLLAAVVGTPLFALRVLWQFARMRRVARALS